MTMHTKHLKKTLSFLLALSSLALSPVRVLAAINNPALSEDLGGSATDSEAATSGAIFVSYLVSLWEAAINIGGLLVLMYFIWGSMEWVTSGGDAGKLEKARGRMMHAVIGLLILVSSFVILGYVSTALFGEDFSILNLSFPTPGNDGP